MLVARGAAGVETPERHRLTGWHAPAGVPLRPSERSRDGHVTCAGVSRQSAFMITNGRKCGVAAGFGSIMTGKQSNLSVPEADGQPCLPIGRELLVSQATLRRAARRAVQVAVLAAGITTILLVFSRQAHAATTPSDTVPPVAAVPAAVSPSAAAATGTARSVTSAVTSAAASVAPAAASQARRPGRRVRARRPGRRAGAGGHIRAAPAPPRPRAKPRLPLRRPPR